MDGKEGVSYIHICDGKERKGNDAEGERLDQIELNWIGFRGMHSTKKGTGGEGGEALYIYIFSPPPPPSIHVSYTFSSFSYFSSTQSQSQSQFRYGIWNGTQRNGMASVWHSTARHSGFFLLFLLSYLKYLLYQAFPSLFEGRHCQVVLVVVLPYLLLSSFVVLT